MGLPTVNDIKKDLFKSKANATFSHYCAGKLFYNFTMLDGAIFQFPIPTVTPQEYYIGTDDEGNTITETAYQLAADLGQTPFSGETKASELNRWIAKAHANNELICLNRDINVGYTSDYGLNGIVENEGGIFPSENDQILGVL